VAQVSGQSVVASRRREIFAHPDEAANAISKLLGGVGAAESNRDRSAVAATRTVRARAVDASFQAEDMLCLGKLRVRAPRR
jgi:hypothetical protein